MVFTLCAGCSFYYVLYNYHCLCLASKGPDRIFASPLGESNEGEEGFYCCGNKQPGQVATG